MHVRVCKLCLGIFFAYLGPKSLFFSFQRAPDHFLRPCYPHLNCDFALSYNVGLMFEKLVILGTPLHMKDAHTNLVCTVT